MKKIAGFTLVELVMFIVITGFIAGGIVLSLMNTLQNTSVVTENTIAMQTAKQCIEWFLGQRYLNGYSSVNCNSTVPSFCTGPNGYLVTVNCNSTTINGDNNYKSFTIKVSGQGDATLDLLLANY